jgi:hypothetical protein
VYIHLPELPLKVSTVQVVQHSSARPVGEQICRVGDLIDRAHQWKPADRAVVDGGQAGGYEAIGSQDQVGPSVVGTHVASTGSVRLARLCRVATSWYSATRASSLAG